MFLNDRRIDCHDHKSASIRKQRENECWTKISNGTPLQKRAHWELTTPENTITYHNALKFCTIIVFSFSWAILTHKRNWRQCLCKILGWQTKSVMVYYGIFGSQLSISEKWRRETVNQEIPFVHPFPGYCSCSDTSNIRLLFQEEFIQFVELHATNNTSVYSKTV